MSSNSRSHASDRSGLGMADRILSLVLSVVLAMSLVPTQALAEGFEELSGDAEVVEEVSGDAAGEEDVTSAEAGGVAEGDEDAAVGAGEEPEGPVAPSSEAGPDDSDDGEVADGQELLAAYLETDDGLVAASVESDAVESADAIAQALLSLDGVGEDDALEAARELAVAAGLEEAPQEDDGLVLLAENAAEAADSVDESDELPSSADGSNVDFITARWLTQDTEDDDSDANLYLRPSGNSAVTATLRINYALSGEHDYAAGDVVITVPLSMFNKRDGSDADALLVPWPEDPSTRQAWNYKIVGDTVQITNTRTMSAATQGYMDLQFNSITPSEVVDMQVSDDFQATIEVVTHLGNLIGATSNALTAQIDTEAVIQRASKRVASDYPKIVAASEIPEAQRVDGESNYVLVRYYANPYLNSNNNTSFSLVLDDAVGNTLVVNDDGSAVDAGIYGFVVRGSGMTYESDTTASKTLVTNQFRSGTLSSTYSYVTVAYPLSQFEEDTTYEFSNAVDYTLTETDNDEADPDGQKVTTAHAEATVRWTYRAPVFVDPTGHFNVFKNGNDDDSYNTMHSSYSTSRDYSPTSLLQLNGYYGIYNSALNDIQDGEDQRISYTIESDAFLFPWTYDGEGDIFDLESYGKKNVRVVTEERGISANGETYVVGEDYTFDSIEFPSAPIVKKAVALNYDVEAGQIVFTTADDGTVEYRAETDVTKIPVVHVQVLVDGEWVDYAQADWTSGRLVITAAEGTTLADGAVKGIELKLPEGTQNVRTYVESNVAAFAYYTRVNVVLDADGAISGYADALFSAYNNPQAWVRNSATLTAYEEDDAGETTQEIVTLSKYGRDLLTGYTGETRASLTKSARLTSSDVDYDAQTATVHYTATMTDQSYIPTITEYAQAVSDGLITPTTSGTWYDLLPEGMTADLTTIRLSTGDTVTDAHTIENWRGTGRTLLVVEADLTPTITRYSEDGLYYCQDSTSISFDATTTFNALNDYGTTAHNVIAFASDADHLGTVEGYVGERDDTSGANNWGTANAFADDEEKEALDDLIADNDNPSVLYAGVTVEFNKLDTAEASLGKLVMVNNDNWWSDGLYYDDAEANARNVYEGGNYAYRISMGSADDTVTSGIVFFDSLENFYAAEGNDQIDIDAARWQGTLVGVDVSPLEERGIEPVVYYSTVENLRLSVDMDNGIQPDEENTDLANAAVWVRADEYTGDLADVKAVAVDASKMQDGSDFELGAGDEIAFCVNMHAPSGEEAAGYIEADAHAYNNVYSYATVIKVGGDTPDTNFIRKDYTKVGLSENSITVAKGWSDEDDRDGMRPESVTLYLYRDGEQMYVDGEPVTATLSDEYGWTHTFKNLPYAHDDGTKIRYSIVEGDVEGYTSATTPTDANGSSYLLTNTHAPERISISGTKTWVGDDESVRPSRVRVNLYADGVYAGYAYATADSNGDWSYTFNNLYKYRDGGIEIEYTVAEADVDDYIASVDGYDLTNTYYPYGDLEISKSIIGATEVSAGQEFTFTVTLTTTDKNGEKVPVDGEYAYTVYDGDGDDAAVVSVDSISTGGTITLVGGQRVVVSDVPTRVTYEVTEGSLDGWALSSSAGTTGTIKSGQTQVASFTNTYSATGRLNLTATKTLTGRALSAYNYEFELLDSSGAVIRTTRNSRATETVTLDDGNVQSSGDVTFGAITYTAADAGNTYTYTIREVEGTRGGVTYSTDVYTAEVKVSDNGDGTLSTDVTYHDAEGTVVEPEDVVLENTYEATGEVELQVQKVLENGTLEDGQFSFALYSVGEEGSSEEIGTATNSADGTVTFDAISYDQTDAGKTYTYLVYEVVGDDSTITYDTHGAAIQVHVVDNGDGTLGITTTYGPGDLEIKCLMCEGEGGEFASSSNLTLPLIYSWAFDGVPQTTEEFRTYLTAYLQYYGWRLDNDTKTTLQALLDQESLGYKLISSDDESFVCEAGAWASCAYCDGTGLVQDSDQSYVFTNSVKPGSLTVEKSVTDDSTGYDPDQLFTFRVFVEGASLPNTDTDRVSVDDGWYIDTAGVLHIYGNVTLTGAGSYRMPWYDNREDVTAVQIEEGASFNSTSWAYLFYEMSNCTSITGLENLDSTGVTSMERMFYQCSSLTSLDLSSFDTSSVTNMGFMFFYCSKLASLDLSTFDTSSVRDMSYMFQNCGSMQWLDISSFDTSNVTSLPYALSSESSLTRIKVGGGTAATSASTSSLGLDISVSVPWYNESDPSTTYTSIDDLQGAISALADGETAWFVKLNSTTTVTERTGDGWNIDSDGVLHITGTVTLTDSPYLARVPWYDYRSDVMAVVIEPGASIPSENWNYLFSSMANCRSISGFSNLDSSHVTSMANMFANTGVTALDLSTLDTSNVTSMYRMFYTDRLSTARLASLDVSSFDTSKVTTMEDMFYRCSQLTSLDLSSFDTSNVTTMYEMFYGCSKLTSLDISNFNTAKVGRIQYFFYKCSNLSSLRIGPGFTRLGSTSLTVQSNRPWYVYGDYSQSITSLSDFATWVAGSDEPTLYVRNYTPLTITYNANGGIGTMATQSENYYYPFTLIPNAFVRAMYKFAGWSTQADGDVLFSDGATVDNVSVIGGTSTARTLDLFAVWDPYFFATEVEPGVYEIQIPEGGSYTLEDIPAGTPYKVYELTPSGWTLVDSSNTSGIIPANDGVTASFTNAYTPDATSITIPAQKLVDGEAASATDEFTFELLEGGEVLQTKTVSAGGTIAFDQINYTSADIGTHTYTVREVAGDDPTVIYDGTAHTYVVEVAPDPDDPSLLAATVTSSEGIVTFENTHKPGTLQISKSVSTDSDTSFSFNVTLDGELYTGEYQVAGETRTAADGIVTLKGGEVATVEAAAGTQYFVTEVDVPSGWSLSSSEGTSGTIASTETSVASFSNSYSASGYAVVTAEKVMADGSAIASGAYTFQLRDSAGEVLAESDNMVSEDGVATVEFPRIEYDEAGTYTYTIVEVAGTDEAVVYDGSVKEVTVTVTDNGDGTLATAVTYKDDDNRFENSYHTGSLSVTKTVTNESLDADVHAETFSVIVELVYPDGSSDTRELELKAGETSMISGLAIGTTWTVSEESLPSGWEIVTIDGATGTVTTDESEVLVTNEYDAAGTAQLSVRKTFDGDLADGQFTFHVFDEEGREVARATNDANGVVSFAPLEYTLEDLGTHTYYIVEENDQQDDVFYDEHTVTATVTVSDAGDGTLRTTVAYDGDALFENYTVQVANLARTGGQGVGLAGFIVVAAGLAWTLRRRRGSEQA